MELASYGISMYPLIREGDISTFEVVDSNSLKVGQVYLFINEDGALVGHRLHSIQQSQQSQHSQPVVCNYLFKGDTCDELDSPVSRDSIIGHLIGVRRGTRWLPSDGIRARWIGWMVQRAPGWSKLMRRLARYRQVTLLALRRQALSSPKRRNVR
ncbi:hypothetical protein ACFO9Q_05070 [Paenibacillus sp. GCM10023252]|uniref:hypothetical protein n=1 Tax=Paenibacillus sp. GCM10023252 TaxID=3252649 RepID=UPI00361A1D63